MLMNLKSNSKVGKAISETASIAYTGELLPTGTASYGGISIDATKRYLKNSGKDKTTALVESGQGKFFNGTNQYINTGIVPNQAEGTLVTRFTYTTGMANRYPVGKSEFYANGRFGITINANGKLVISFGSNGSAYEYTPSLINGKSYHVAFKHIGNVAYLYVDGLYVGESLPVTLATHSIPMYLGAFNVSGTASTYFNNVIGETYYYDVALPDTAIQSLYLYPEKVKAYNGAIVPDIGNEANCKLFLPMCESNKTIGNHVVNVAVAKGTNLVTNGTFDTDTLWLKGTGWTISDGKANVSNSGTISYLTKAEIAPTVGKRYRVAFTVSNYVAGTVRFTCGGVNGQAVTANGAYVEIFTAVSAVQFSLYGGTTAVCSFDNVSFEEVSAFQIANFTASCVDSAKQLSYGAQCIAWNRDSLGVLLGMSNGLSFDGGVSAKGVNTGITLPNTSTWAAEAIIYIDGISTSGYLKAIYGGNGNFLGMQRTSLTTNAVDISCMARVYSTTLATGWHHIAVDAIGKFYIDGVLVSTQTPLFTGTPSVVYIGSDSSLTSNLKNIVSTPKIHKGTQYAKFNIAKAWAKAKKTITKLGA